MRISDWSSDVCSSDLLLLGMGGADLLHLLHRDAGVFLAEMEHHRAGRRLVAAFIDVAAVVADGGRQLVPAGFHPGDGAAPAIADSRHLAGAGADAEAWQGVV